MGFFKRLFTGVKHMLIGRARLEEVFDTQIVISEKMEQACTLWASMYENEPPWKSVKDGKLSLNLAKAVCSELARLATFESEIEVTGDNDRAKYLNDQMQKVIKKLRNHVEKAGSTSGIVFKPYISGDKIRVNAVVNHLNAVCGPPPPAFGQKTATATCWARFSRRWAASTSPIPTALCWRICPWSGFWRPIRTTFSSSPRAIIFPAWKITSGASLRRIPPGAG